MLIKDQFVRTRVQDNASRGYGGETEREVHINQSNGCQMDKDETMRGKQKILRVLGSRNSKGVQWKIHGVDGKNASSAPKPRRKCNLNRRPLSPPKEEIIRNAKSPAHGSVCEPPEAA